MATYYISTKGSNAAAGTSVGAAWATLAYAETNTTVGDIIVVLDDGVHNVGSGVNFNTTATVNRHIFGADATGNIGASVPTVRATSSGSFVLSMPIGGTLGWIKQNGNSNAAEAGVFNYNALVVNCEATGATSHGFKGQSTSYYVDCSAYGNGGSGFRIGGYAVNCQAMDNAAHGFQGLAHLIHCAALNNTSNGVDLPSNSLVYKSTFAGNSGSGIWTNGSNQHLYGNISISNGAYGFDFGWGTGNNSDTFVARNILGTGGTANTSGGLDGTPTRLFIDTDYSDPSLTDIVGTIPSDIDVRPSINGSTAEGVLDFPAFPSGPTSSAFIGAAAPDWSAFAGGGGGVFLPFMRVG